MNKRQIGWRHYNEDLYTASLILTERPARIIIEIAIEPLKPRQPFIRVSEKVVKRKRCLEIK